MQPPIPAETLWMAAALFLGAGLGCVLIWGVLVGRMARGETILPCEPRRPVPWRGSDVLLVLLVYFFPALLALGQLWMAGGPPAPPPPAAEKADVSHPVIELLQKHPSMSAWLLCLLAVVLVAPIVEETFFRLVLQGWLESVEARSRPRVRLWPGIRGFWPVGIASLLFASLHFRSAQTPLPPEEMLRLLARAATWNVVALGVVGTVLVARRGASWSDLGIVPSKFWGDVCLGLLAFVAVAAPTYVLQMGLNLLLKDIAADPITLTLFASVLGFLYFRTHRLVPSIVLHMALNGTSLLLAWLLSGR